ncbi:hypothetical protein [Sagittula stellata]|uniref:Uncharacterized protein n=1 Tax=Sagittula stellata (strain ATCC 700073 / DSM 11524 / E-37) TaxID=388399 RepID=A3K4L6_SAGS3|nr:hypothetical protein [Sagittula stellata]EBA07915.1 hypothetical protein SSE37_01640 [Sagittula stellata E-37]
MKHKFMGGVLAAAMLAALPAVAENHSPEPEDNLTEFVDRTTALALDNTDRVKALRTTLADSMNDIEMAGARVQEMRDAVDAVIEELERGGEIDSLLTEYLDFAVAEEQRLRTSSNPLLREEADAWVPLIARTEVLIDDLSSVRIKLNEQVVDLGNRAELIEARIRRNAFESALNAAEEAVDGLEALSASIDELAQKADKEIERTEDASE